MNENFFQKNYSEKLRLGDSPYMQKDEYVYAVNKSNMKLLLVIDDITSNYNTVSCIDFLDEGIMTKHNYYLDSDINYISTVNSLYHFYNKNRFTFTIEEIDHEKIISSLRKVFYFLQPTLDSMTLCGGGESNTITDPNFYEGHYFLKNGEEYTILKHRDMLYFYNGSVSYNYIMKKQEEISGYIYCETIDFTLYSKAIKLRKLKNEIIFCTSERLDYRYIEVHNLIEEYELLKTELKQIEY
jgi:hypothetical protein